MCYFFHFFKRGIEKTPLHCRIIPNNRAYLPEIKFMQVIIVIIRLILFYSKKSLYDDGFLL